MKLPPIKLDSTPRKPVVLAKHVVEAMVVVTCPACGMELSAALLDFLPRLRRTMTRQERMVIDCECGAGMEIEVNGDYGERLT